MPQPVRCPVSQPCASLLLCCVPPPPVLRVRRAERVLCRRRSSPGAGAGGRRWSTVSECRAQLRSAALAGRQGADSESLAAGLPADEPLLREARDIVR